VNFVPFAVSVRSMLDSFTCSSGSVVVVGVTVVVVVVVVSSGTWMSTTFGSFG
jgi:hypothetical protein